MSLNEDKSQADIPPTDPLIILPGISEEVPKRINWFSRFSGIFYTLLASSMFVSSTFIIKELGVDLLDAFLLRFFLQTVFTLIFVLWKHYTLLGGTAQQILLQILCCATGAAGFFLFFTAVRYIELSDANTLSYTRVVWTVVLSVIVYRERPSIGTLIALPLTLLGVVFVTQPTLFFSSNRIAIIHSNNQILGFICAFAVALTSSINVILFKQLISTSRDIKPSVLNLQFCCCVFIALLLNQVYKRVYLQVSTPLAMFLTWRYLLSSVVCLLSIVGSILCQKAIKREHPAVFSLLGSADIIFALILQNVFTSVRSNFYALLGSALVIGSVVLLGVSRIINERRAMKEKKVESC